LAAGSQAARDSLRSGAAHLLLVDEGASANTKKEFRDAGAYREVPIAFLPPGALGEAIGRSVCMVAAVSDRSFAEGILKRLNTLTIDSAGVH